ncbi:hypothetical protein EJB05_27104, partial [Eragrostis curvula]
MFEFVRYTKGFVRKNGFDHLLEINAFTVPTPLLEWLMEQMITGECEFRHRNKSIKFVRSLATDILGIPSENVPIILDSKDPCVIRKVEEAKFRFSGGSKTSMSEIAYMDHLDLDGHADQYKFRDAAMTPYVAHPLDLSGFMNDGPSSSGVGPPEAGPSSLGVDPGLQLIVSKYQKSLKHEIEQSVIPRLVKAVAPVFARQMTLMAREIFSFCQSLNNSAVPENADLTVGDNSIANDSVLGHEVPNTENPNTVNAHVTFSEQANSVGDVNVSNGVEPNEALVSSDDFHIHYRSRALDGCFISQDSDTTNGTDSPMISCNEDDDVLDNCIGPASTQAVVSASNRTGTSTLDKRNRKKRHLRHTDDAIVVKLTVSSALLEAKLQESSGTFDSESVEAELTRINGEYRLDRCDLLFFSKFSRNHWVLICINVLHKEVNFFDLADSLTSEDRDELLDNVVLNFQRACLNAEIVPKQKRRWDCGIYVILYMLYFNGRLLMIFDEKEAAKFRKLLAHKCITSLDNEVDA